MSHMVVVELGKPASSPTLILSYFGKLKFLVGLDIRDVGIDNDDPPTHLRHQIDELARLIQVVKDAAAEDHIEDAIRRQVVDIDVVFCCGILYHLDEPRKKTTSKTPYVAKLWTSSYA